RRAPALPRRRASATAGVCDRGASRSTCCHGDPRPRSAPLADPPARPDAHDAADRRERESPHREHRGMPQAGDESANERAHNRADPDQALRAHAMRVIGRAAAALVRGRSQRPSVAPTCRDGGPEARRRNSRCLRGKDVLPPPLRPARRCVILNHMVQYAQARLDASFAALSDPTRPGVLEQLGRSDASITRLAEKFHMTLTGMKKHVGVLERAGLVTTEKVGRVRTCMLGKRRMEEEMAWLERYRELWDARFTELDRVVEELKREGKTDGRKKSE